MIDGLVFLRLSKKMQMDTVMYIMNTITYYVDFNVNWNVKCTHGT